MEYLTQPIAYLDNNDFDNDGNLVNTQLLEQNKPIFIMIQAVFCGHCTIAKPYFQKFAENNLNKVICCTIQGDSRLESTKGINNKLRTICPDFQGYPSYIVMYKGKKIPYNRGRKTEDFEFFLNNLY